MRVLLGSAVLAALIVATLSSSLSIAHAGLIDPSADTDMDGCTAAEELGPDPMLGGLRDPNDPWDFYDVNLDGYVDLQNDILGTIQAYGQGPAGVLYTLMKDRGPGLTAPDGVITLQDDILGVILQYQHRCLARDWCNGDVKDGALLSTEPFEAGVGDVWQDCFAFYGDDGMVKDYVTREATVELTYEDITEEEAAAMGYVLPEWPVGLAAPASPTAGWRTWTCHDDITYHSRAGLEVTELHVSQFYVTTPFTNIAWPPSDGFAFADADYIWSVAEDPEPRPEPYPIAWYDIPNNIVSVGETYASARFEINVGVLGISVTLDSVTDSLYLEFGYDYCVGSLTPG
ncbi:MAG: flexitail domain-containing putative surface protein [Dehalococcoidia bacterium]